MFDTNNFKRKIKQWIIDHPSGDVQDLRDFCEELIPPHQFSSYQWLIEQTLGWYQHILNNKKVSSMSLSDDEGF